MSFGTALWRRAAAAPEGETDDVELEIADKPAEGASMNTRRRSGRRGKYSAMRSMWLWVSGGGGGRHEHDDDDDDENDVFEDSGGTRLRNANWRRRGTWRSTSTTSTTTRRAGMMMTMMFGIEGKKRVIPIMATIVSMIVVLVLHGLTTTGAVSESGPVVVGGLEGFSMKTGGRGDSGGLREHLEEFERMEAATLQQASQKRGEENGHGEDRMEELGSRGRGRRRRRRSRLVDDGAGLTVRQMMVRSRDMWTQGARKGDGKEVEGWDSGEWKQICEDVVIAVKTGSEVMKERLTTLRNVGWWNTGHAICHMVVVGLDSDAALGVVGLRDYAKWKLIGKKEDVSGLGKRLWEAGWLREEGWNGDREKNLVMSHLLHEMFPGKLWYILLDDDTHLFLSSLAKTLLQPSLNSRVEREYVYLGRMFAMKSCGVDPDGLSLGDSIKHSVFAHGGAGIVLNGPALQVVAMRTLPCVRRLRDCWGGDMQLSLCLREAHVEDGAEVSETLGSDVETRQWGQLFIPIPASVSLSDKGYVKLWKDSTKGPVTFHNVSREESIFLTHAEQTLWQQQRTQEREKKNVSTWWSFDRLRSQLFAIGLKPVNSQTDRAHVWFTDVLHPASAAAPASALSLSLSLNE